MNQLVNVDERNTAERGNLVNSIAAYMMLHPMSVFDFMRELRSYRYEDEQFGMVSAALGQAGTPEAQQAMIQYMRRKGESDEFKQVMLNLAFVGKPIKEAEVYMRSLHSASSDPDIHNKSAFALGIMASNLGDVEVERAKAIREDLASYLNSASTHEEKVVYIRAIANAADKSMLNVLKPYLVNGEGVTLEVLKALRDMESDEARSILLEYARSDNREYRYVAYQSLIKYEPVHELLDQYSQALTEEKERHITETILRNLNEVKSDHDRARYILNEYASRCPTDRLCKLASKES